MPTASHTASPDVHLLLGRVDGKLDIVIANQSAQYAKLEQLGTRVSNAEIRLTTIETFDQSKKSHRALWISLVSVGIALFTALFSMIKTALGH